jgi:hypothetical protein
LVRVVLDGCATSDHVRNTLRSRPTPSIRCCGRPAWRRGHQSARAPAIRASDHSRSRHHRSRHPRPDFLHQLVGVGHKLGGTATDPKRLRKAITAGSFAEAQPSPSRTGSCLLGHSVDGGHRLSDACVVAATKVIAHGWVVTRRGRRVRCQLAADAIRRHRLTCSSIGAAGVRARRLVLPSRRCR